MSYEIAIALGGYADMMGMTTPKSRKAGRAPAKRSFPRLVEAYRGLYGASLTARYYRGCAMTESEWCEAARRHRMLAGNIPVQ